MHIPFYKIIQELHFEYLTEYLKVNEETCPITVVKLHKCLLTHSLSPQKYVTLYSGEVDFSPLPSPEVKRLLHPTKACRD